MRSIRGLVAFLVAVGTVAVAVDAPVEAQAVGGEIIVHEWTVISSLSVTYDIEIVFPPMEQVCAPNAPFSCRYDVVLLPQNADGSFQGLDINRPYGASPRLTGSTNICRFIDGGGCVAVTHIALRVFDGAGGLSTVLTAPVDGVADEPELSLSVARWQPGERSRLHYQASAVGVHLDGTDGPCSQGCVVKISALQLDPNGLEIASRRLGRERYDEPVAQFEFEVDRSKKGLEAFTHMVASVRPLGSGPALTTDPIPLGQIVNGVNIDRTFALLATVEPVLLCVVIAQYAPGNTNTISLPDASEACFAGVGPGGVGLRAFLITLAGTAGGAALIYVVTRDLGTEGEITDPDTNEPIQVPILIDDFIESTDPKRIRAPYNEPERRQELLATCREQVAAANVVAQALADGIVLPEDPCSIMGVFFAGAAHISRGTTHRDATAHIAAAQSDGPWQWTLVNAVSSPTRRNQMTAAGIGTPREWYTRAAFRPNACDGINSLVFDCDEFPFFTTAQSGPLAANGIRTASLHPVPITDNRGLGGTWGTYARQCGWFEDAGQDRGDYILVVSLLDEDGSSRIPLVDNPPTWRFCGADQD